MNAGKDALMRKTLMYLSEKRDHLFNKVIPLLVSFDKTN